MRSEHADEYWIDESMIDAAEQGRGYGRAAVRAAVRMIVARYPRCRAVRLTVNPANDVAAAFYRSLGFRDTGRLDWREQERSTKSPARRSTRTADSS